MRTFSLALLVLAAGCGGGIPADKVSRGWSDDLDAALARAKGENKHVLVLFTGHSW